MSGILPYHYRGPDGNLMRFKKRKSRFTFPEVELLLNEVQKKRHILVGKFNRGISKELKHRMWAALTARINEVSECHREVIEVIKKWADLKCDTKRRVAAMRAAGATPAQIAQELSPVETMVHQILQMSNSNKITTALTFHDRMDDDNEDSLDMSEIPHSSSSMANGMPHSFGLAMPPPIHARIPGKRDLGPPTDMMYSYDSAVPLTDLPADTSENEDSTPFIEPASHKHQNTVNTPQILSPPIAERSNMQEKPNHYTLNGRPASGIATFTPPSRASSSGSVPAPPSSRPAPVDPHSLREHLAQSASQSLQEQQASTLLIGSLSRSLETLAESVQRMVHTQKQFSRDTLQLQRDTLHVLRDFSSSTLTLLQDKIHGHHNL
ncbi:uncharacterized protein zgc:113149 [Triplophysa dalaica]|uniref:uncharacterized protein zgc:113149 n=1 Tax=Triplophysa dalaica TaxID=1582913 RepID=UPI0024E04126|nr:uncharacterized protein zgc:113149 [Triplophysa dalaica]